MVIWLEDMDEKHQIIVNKLYGTLLAPDGLFREDHLLLQQVIDECATNDNLTLHGVRLLILMATGLQFIPS